MKFHNQYYPAVHTALFLMCFICTLFMEITSKIDILRGLAGRSLVTYEGNFNMHTLPKVCKVVGIYLFTITDLFNKVHYHSGPIVVTINFQNFRFFGFRLKF